VFCCDADCKVCVCVCVCFFFGFSLASKLACVGKVGDFVESIWEGIGPF
jgi:hypothetical protein